MKRGHGLLVGLTTFLLTAVFFGARPVSPAERHEEPASGASAAETSEERAADASVQPPHASTDAVRVAAAEGGAAASDDSWDLDEGVAEIPSFSLRGEVTAGAQSLSGDLGSSQFTRYREVPSGGYIRSLFLLGESRDTPQFVEFRAMNLKQADDRVELRLGYYGRHRLQFLYDRAPQTFSNTGRLLLRQGEPGQYHLSNDIRNQLQAISQTDTNPATPGTQIDTAAYNDVVAAGASPINLTQRRRTAALGYVGDLSPDVKLSVSYGEQDRRGLRPLGATFGPPSPTSTQVELPEPLDYRSRDWTASMELSGDRGALCLEMRTSSFANRVRAIGFDHPLILTDGVARPSRGQISLPPSNEARDMSLSGVLHLWSGASLSGTLSAGRWQQNEPFLPATVNTALATAPLPASSLNGRIDTSLVDVGLNVPLGSALSTRAYYRRYGNRNRTPHLTFSETVSTDYSVSKAEVETEPVGYAQGNAGLEVTYRALSSLTLQLSGDRETWDRTHRDVSKTREARYGFSADYRLSSWLLARGSLRSSRRRIHGLYRASAIELPELRRFDEADRDRNEASVMLQLAPPEARWDAMLTYTNGRDHYLRSSYGLADDRNSSVSLDASYSLSDWTGLFAGYTREWYRSTLNSRYRPVGGNPPVVTDDPANDWQSKTRDGIDTVWFGLNSTLVPEKWDLDLAMSASFGRSRTLASGAAGGAAQGEPPALPDVTYQWLSPQATLRYQIRSGLALGLGYRMESYRVTDFAQDSLDTYMPTSDALTSIWLGARQPNYVAHVATMELTAGF